jgi:hypothetical protein
LQAYGLSPDEWGVWFVRKTYLASDVQPNCVGIDYACRVAASWESPYACTRIRRFPAGGDTASYMINNIFPSTAVRGDAKSKETVATRHAG